ncbi:MAG TPA: hypothetical protein VM513_04350 [Kofleriaceae bacterium]|jgi:hypothetical protein|nr:hypothetical protein [Kofleriaceae bacterium]
MLRVLAVVATFVVLNAGGFVAYRALQPVHAALIPPAASETTFARPVAPIHPKSTASPSKIEVEPTPVDSPSTIVSEATASAAEKPPARTTPRVRVARPTRSVVSKPALGESLKSKEVKSTPSDRLLDMESNPYKRGE